MDLENEVYFLKEEIIRLKEENQGLQQDRELAGEIGKSLLENNQELEKKLEEVNNDYISTLGSLEVVIKSISLYGFFYSNRQAYRNGCND